METFISKEDGDRPFPSPPEESSFAFRASVSEGGVIERMEVTAEQIGRNDAIIDTLQTRLRAMLTARGELLSSLGINPEDAQELGGGAVSPEDERNLASMAELSETILCLQLKTIKLRRYLRALKVRQHRKDVLRRVSVTAEEGTICDTTIKTITSSQTVETDRCQKRRPSVTFAVRTCMEDAEDRSSLRFPLETNRSLSSFGHSFVSDSEDFGESTAMDEESDFGTTIASICDEEDYNNVD